MLHKNKLFVLLTFVLNAFLLKPQEIDRKNVFASQKLGDVSVVHQDGDFIINDIKGSHLVPRCFVDQSLRGIPQENLNKILGCGAYLYVNKMSSPFDAAPERDSIYSLRLHGRLHGGGPITAKIAYWTTKGIGYGLYAVGTYFFDHELPVHHPEITQSIEAAATTAECAGLASPTP